MPERPEFIEKLERLAEGIEPRHLPDPAELRRASDQRAHHRAVLIAVVTTIAIFMPLALQGLQDDKSSAPVDTPDQQESSTVSCMHRPSRDLAPERTDFDRHDGERPNGPGWLQTRPPIPPGHHVTYESVAGNTSGYVALGRSYQGAFGRTFHGQQSWLWRSDDGVHWDAYDRSTLGRFWLDILATRNSFYSPGRASDGSPAVWASTDGLHWRASTVQADPGPAVRPEGKSVVVYRLTCANHLLIATGLDHKASAVWTSTDGQRWTRRDLHDNSFVGVSIYSPPSSNALGNAGSVVMAPRGEGWAPETLWFHKPTH
jgi:hypothetical protein